MSPIPLKCERVRSQISVALDAEVSELDRRLVAAHLTRCAECRAVESAVRAFTEQLRAAPLESPRPSIVVTRGRSRRRALLRTAEYSAAATVLIAVLGVLTLLDMSDSRGTTRLVTPANLFQTAWSPEQELAQLDPAVPSARTDANAPGPINAI